MSDSKTKEWPLYVMTFVALWQGYVVISLHDKVPWEYLKGVLLREAIAPAFITIFLYWILRSTRGKK